MLELNLYYCDTCDYLLEVIGKEGAKLICCDKEMKKLVPNTTEAATEKHIPDVTINDGVLFAKVGSVEHPMTLEHYIKTIYVLTDKGMLHREDFEPGDKPEITVDLEGARKASVYAYCNLHGLWKAEI